MADRQASRSMSRVLIVDEDLAAAASLQYHLQEHGFWADIEPAGALRMRAELFGGYAILIMEVMLSYMDGFDLLRQVRDHSGVPVLVLSARGTESDRVAGLELGADDYLVKPSSPREVLARVRALLRRSHPAPGQGGQPEVLKSGRLTLWPTQRRAEWLGAALKVTDAEFDLLEMLLRHAGHAVGKAELSHALGHPPARTDRSVDVHMSRIRRKLAALADGRPLIRAVHFNGYQLLEE